MESSTPKEKQDILKTINEYLNLIILMPILIGGIWQLISLSSISMSYIRFFSLSQLAADGLLVLIYLALIILPVSICVYFITHRSRRKGSDEPRGEIENHGFLFKKSKVTGTVLILVAFLLVGLMFYKLFDEDKYDIISSFLLLMMAICATAVATLAFIEGLAGFGINPTLDSVKDMGTKLAASFFILSLLNFGYLFYRLAIAFHQNYTIPKNLENLDGLFDPKKERLIYYNDSYIFIENIEPKPDYDENKIRVIKFDELFESKTPTN